MTEVISVKFARRGKSYFFDPGDLKIETGDKVIVDTAKGLDIGECSAGNHSVEDESIVKPLRGVVRLATEADLRIAEEHRQLEREAFDICKEKIAQHGLDMKLVDVEYGFEGNKILFFFTSDGRVDFRELVKDLASVFRTRIELRQIGVRDETKMMGGLGICGRPYCCNQFLNDFEPVSTKMAKTQSMSLNPTKISGSCGRLMCCLRYEQDAYEELIKNIPKNGAFVQTTAGYGSVIQSDILRQKVKVRMDYEGEPEIKTFDAKQVAAVPGGRPKPGEEPPQVLEYVEPEEPEAEQSEPEDPWLAPELFADSAEDTEALQPKRSHSEGGKGHGQHHHKGGKGHSQQGGKPRNRPQSTGGQSGAQRQKSADRPKSEGGGKSYSSRNRRKRSYRPKPGGQEYNND